MCHDQQHGVGRRLFQDLQHRVGTVAIHFIGRVDDGDTPLPHRRRHMHEGAELAHIIDGDLGLGRLLATLVEDARVEAREDGDWLRLLKRARGIKPAGSNA